MDEPIDMQKFDVQIIAAGETKAMHHLQNAAFSSLSNVKTRVSVFQNDRIQHRLATQ